MSDSLADTTDPHDEPPSRASRVLVVVVVIGVAVAAGVAFYVAENHPNFVNVSVVDWTGSNLCGGLSGNTSTGFTGSTGSSHAYTVAPIHNTNRKSSCTIDAITPQTAGFSVSGGNIPLTIRPGGTTALNFTIQLPGSEYSGNLTLVVS